MGNIFAKNKEYRLLMFGLDAAGKTSILYRMKLGEVVTIIPTIGFNVETVVNQNVSLTMWDVGLRSKSRPLLRHYYPNTQAVILVVDSSDRDRIDEVKYEMDTMLKEDELRGIPVAVLCNKQDLTGIMSIPEITEHLQLYKLNRQCEVFPTSATTGEGLPEVLNWLSNTLTGDHTDSLPSDQTHNTQVSHSTRDYFWKGWESVKKIFAS